MDQALTALRLNERLGANVLVVTADDGALSASACESMNFIDGINAAGAIIRKNAMSTEFAPGVSFQRAVVSPKYLSVIAPWQASGDGAVGADISRELGIFPDSRVRLNDGSVIDHPTIVSTDDRAPDQARWLYSVSPATGEALECWVEAAPGAREAIKGYIPVALEESSALKIAALQRDRAPSLIEQWDSRVVRFGWIVAGAAGTLFLGFAMMLRRDEYSLYALSGHAAPNVALVTAIEATVCAITALACSLLWTIATLALLGANIAATMPQVVQTAAMTYLLMAASIIPMAVLAVPKDPLRAVKNRG
ncbi:hypothetical protein [Agromyces sp. NPDC058126]|uniref:hypothetical protein n=1 Tax=Agromyces sp. NPDC058126 TaxID=3346350 RepID=UPI0036D8D837